MRKIDVMCSDDVNLSGINSEKQISIMIENLNEFHRNPNNIVDTCLKLNISQDCEGSTQDYAIIPYSSIKAIIVHKPFDI